MAIVTKPYFRGHNKGKGGVLETSFYLGKKAVIMRLRGNDLGKHIKEALLTNIDVLERDGVLRVPRPQNLKWTEEQLEKLRGKLKKAQIELTSPTREEVFVFKVTDEKQNIVESSRDENHSLSSESDFWWFQPKKFNGEFYFYDDDDKKFVCKLNVNEFLVANYLWPETKDDSHSIYNLFPSLDDASESSVKAAVQTLNIKMTNLGLIITIDGNDLQLLRRESL